MLLIPIAPRHRIQEFPSQVIGEQARDQVFGQDQARLPNTSKVATPGLSSETQVMGLDLAGIAISAGSACAAGRVEPPYVLTAMQVPDDLAVSAFLLQAY